MRPGFSVGPSRSCATGRRRQGEEKEGAERGLRRRILFMSFTEFGRLNAKVHRWR